MKKLILLLFIPIVSLGQEVNYNNEDHSVTIDVPENIGELMGYPSFEELNSEALNFYRRANKLSTSQPNQSIILYKKAINKDPSFVQAYDNLARTYRVLKEYDLAIKYYHFSQKIFPGGAASYQNLAVVYKLQKEWDKAINQYEKLIELYPNNPEGYYGLAGIYLEIEESLFKALANAKKALAIYEINPPNYIGDGYALVGLIHYYRGEYEYAKIYLTKAKAKYYENNLTDIFKKYEAIYNSL